MGIYSESLSAIASNDWGQQPSCLVKSHPMHYSPLHRVQVTMV